MSFRRSIALLLLTTAVSACDDSEADPSPSATSVPDTTDVPRSTPSSSRPSTTSPSPETVLSVPDETDPLSVTTESLPEGPPSVELGGAAWSTVYGFGGAWIQVDPPIDQLVKVDAVSGTVTVTIDGGTGAAIAEDAVWVTVGGQETRKLDPETGEVLLTASTPDAYYVSVGAGAVWVPAEGGIARIDQESGAVVATISIDSGEVTDLAAADDAVWVSDKNGGRVFRIDPATNAVVAEIETGAGAHDFAIDKHGVWVTNYRANTVSRIDPATNEVVATIEGVGSGVGISAGDGAIWVSSKGGGISRIDPASNEVEPIAEFSGWNYGVAYGDNELWVSSVDEQLVYRLDPDAVANES